MTTEQILHYELYVDLCKAADALVRTLRAEGRQLGPEHLHMFCVERSAALASQYSHRIKDGVS